jgi:predicted ATPase/serine/threonine protein kinase
LADPDTVAQFGPNPCPICGYDPSTGLDRRGPTRGDCPGPSAATVDLRLQAESPALLGQSASPLVYGPYRILGLIGRGGMGIVYRARHEATRREVALKTVRVRQRDILHRFRRELHAMSRIRHRGLVPILETGQDQGQPWYAMELLQGMTLHDHLRQAWNASTSEGGRLPCSTPSAAPTEPLHDPRPSSGGTTRPHGLSDRPMPLSPAALQDFLTLIARLCAVLAYLHGEGIVHRDLKPRNIVVRPDGTPVLFDFGLASYFGACGREQLTVGGKFEGTPEYMAPEQVLGEYVDARADLYAVGCILYEGVTGHVPFPERGTDSFLDACIRDTPLAPSRLVQGVPEALNELILRLLAKRPRDRIGHARTIMAALARLGGEIGDWSTDLAARDYLYRPGFVGRDALLELLERRIFEESQEAGGRCLFLRGRSGSGKTRLIMEVACRLERLGRTVITGECLPLGAGNGEGPGVRSRPLHPFRAVLQAVADACLELGPAEADRLLGPRAKVLAVCEPSLAALPGQEHYPDPAPQAHDDVRVRLMDALADTLAAFARRTPFVLLLDDLQWADELTLNFLALFHLGTWKTPGLAIVGTYRSEDGRVVARGCGGVFADIPVVDLNPLEEARLHDIIREMLGSDEPYERFVRQVARRAQGNPFFVAELLRAAISREMLYRDEDGRWSVRLPWSAEDEELPLPESLHDLIVHRLDGLSSSGRNVLETAAVFGREVETDLLECAGLPDAGLMIALQELLAAQVLEACPNGVYRFLHDKLREVVYTRLPAGRRRELHRNAALTLETRYSGDEDFARHSPSLAHHWQQSINEDEAEPDRVARALDYLEKSAGQTTQSGLMLEAVEHGLAAARLLGADVPRTPDAIAAALADEIEQFRRLMGGRQPLDLLLLPPADDPGLDRLIGLLQAIHPAAHTSNQYHLSAFLAVKNLCLTLTRGRGRTAPCVYGLFTIVARNVLDDSRLADAFSRLALEEDARQGGGMTAVVAFLRSWFVGHWIAAFRDSLDICQLGIDAGRTSGDFLYFCFSHANYVICLAASGAPLATVVRAAEEHLAPMERRVLISHYHCVLERQFACALAGLTRGPLSLSDETFDEERDLASICRTNNSTQIGYYHTYRLKLHYYRGEARQALAHAEKALAVLPSFKGTPAEVDLISFHGLALAMRAAEVEEEAKAEYLDAARAHRAMLARWTADCPANFEHKLRLLDGEIARLEGRDADAFGSYIEAARSADAFGFTQHAALAWERAGRHHAHIGDGPAVEAAFAEAQARYRSWGASTLVDRLGAARYSEVAG